MARTATIRGIEIAVVLAIMLGVSRLLPEEEQIAFVMAAIWGLLTFLLVEVAGGLLDAPDEALAAAAKGGVGAFLYLEVLDASFSFDGVIGAFALSNNLFIIAIGLGIGAMYVGSMTIMLVEKGTLARYRFLEHGAFWAILALSVVMYAQALVHIPEVITGLAGAGLIGLALWSSIRWNRRAGRNRRPEGLGALPPRPPGYFGQDEAAGRGSFSAPPARLYLVSPSGGAAMFFSSKSYDMVTPDQALPGRSRAIPTADTHFLTGRPLAAPVPEGMEVAVFGMGCFWGVERIFWQIPGVWLTMVGYGAGYTPNPTYQEVCTGRTGHTELVRVIYDPKVVSYGELLRVFWENHDPTQGMRQGNDRGTQYRSGIYTTSPEQAAQAKASLAAYQARLIAARFGPITTEIKPVGAFYMAEDYHQQYLAKNPGGYCGIGGTGVSCPVGLTA